ncbi:MAG TPA: hypothetical protein VFJ13_10035 [Paracoccaceae bacterium]|nr:hypothetical protein [Paracoccaceae bacterium]
MADQIDEWLDAGRTDTMADALGWFSIGLGTVELMAPEALDAWLGLGHHETATRLYGLREIGVGAGILISDDPTPWLWGRVAGDVLDLASLAPALSADNPQRNMAATAVANVAMITALDVVCAVASGRRRLH